MPYEPMETVFPKNTSDPSISPLKKKITRPAIIIPAFKPGKMLIDLVDALLADSHPLIIIINDGSGDAFLPIFQKLEIKKNVVVLTHAVNLGKGAALKIGFNHILVNHAAIAGVVTVDSDGQHRSEDVKLVSDELNNNPQDLFLGVRKFRGDIPLRSAFGNLITAFVFRFLIGKRISDTQTGLRGIPSFFLPHLLRVEDDRYEFELNMLIIAASKKIQIREIPIATIYEKGNPTSHFNPWLDSLRIYFVFVRFISASLLIALTDLSIFGIVYHFSQNLLASIICGRLVALLLALVTSQRFVFKSKRNARQIVPKLLFLWVTLLILSYGLTNICVNWWHWNVYLSRILTDSTLFLLNFTIQRELIFAKHKENLQTSTS